MKLRSKIMIALALGLIAVFPSLSSATPVLSLSSGGTTLNISDNGVDDANSAVGAISFNGVVGEWQIVIDGGSGAGLLLKSSDATYFQSPDMSIGPPDLVIEFSDSFVGDGSARELTPALTGDQPWRAYMQYQSFFNGSLIYDTGIIDPMFFSIDYPNWDSPVGAYTLSQKLIVSHPGNTQLNDYLLVTNFSASLGPSAVPEPSSLILLGSGLIGAALIAKRKM